MKTVSDVLGVARSNLIEQKKDRPPKRMGRPPQPDGELLAEIKAVIAEMPTYRYRRVWAVLRRNAKTNGWPSPNHK